MQIVSKLLCATVSTESVSEGVDITDSSIAQLSIPSTSDAATQVPTIKMKSVHISVRIIGRDKGKIILCTYLYKHI